MATNFHKDLPDSQIHNPKGFMAAPPDSVLIKNKNNILEWIPRNYTYTCVITCVADVSGTTGGRSFFIKTKTNSYHVWFDADNSDNTTTPSGFTAIEVDISSNDNANTVASALKTALDAKSDLSASVLNEKVTLTIGPQATCGVVPYNHDTSFKLVTTRTNSTNEYLTTDSNGNIGWKSQPAAVTTSPFMYHHFGGYMRPKSSTNRYLGHSGGGDTAETFNLDLGSAITSGSTSIQPELIPSLGSFLATSNMVAKQIHYTVAHDNSTAHANIEMHLFRVRPGSGTSGRPIHWFAGADSLGTNVLVVDDEVKYGHFNITTAPGDNILLQGDQLMVVLKSNVDVGITFSIGMEVQFI